MWLRLDVMAVVVSLIVAASPAWAVDLVGVTAARFEWAPAPGPVVAYLVFVTRDGSLNFSPAAESFASPDKPMTLVHGRAGDRIRVRVAAVGPQLALVYSPPSDEVYLAPSVNGSPPFDFEGDGASELVFQSSATGSLFRWSELPSPNVSAIASGIAPGAVWTFVDSGDYDGDGKSDVLWVVPGSGRYVLCRSDGESPRLCGDFALLSPTASLVGLGDVDLDGRRDVVVRSREGGVTNEVCFGNGAFLDEKACGPSIGFLDTASWAIVASGDQDSDGRADLMLHHLQTGLVYTCFVSSVGGMSCTLAASALGPGYRVVGIGDADGDGRGEVLLRNAAQRVTLVCRLANGVIGGDSCGALNVDGRWQLLGAGDYDADGRADVVWRDPGAGLVRLDFLSGLAAKGSPLLVPVGPSFRVLAR